MRVLYHFPLSPFARKVRLALSEKRLPFELRIEKVWERRPEYLEMNPAGTVPTLTEENGLVVPDSGVICEYLDSVGDEMPLFPPAGPARWRALRQQAIGDGIMDAAVARRMDQGRPQEAARDAFMARQAAAVERALDLLEADVPAQHVDIGAIAIACALGYLDLRFAPDAWREGRGKLAQWYGEMMERPEIAGSAPPG